MLAQTNAITLRREFAADYAFMLYRVGLFHKSLKLLSPYVRPLDSLEMPATPREKAVYSAILLKIGSIEEAVKILNEINGKCAEADLFLAYANQTEWNYKVSIPLLQRYLQCANVSEYELTVVKTNLLSALISEKRLVEAGELLAQLDDLTRQKKWVLLSKNIQELSGQLAVVQEDFTQAEKRLEMASRASGREDDVWNFLIKKWQAIVAYRQYPDHPASVEKLRNVRDQAQVLTHWESVRECDRLLAMALRDENLLAKVYFGTPHTAYRKRLLDEAEGLLPLPKTYVWGSSQGRVFDLNSAREAGGDLLLKPGHLLHLACLALTADLYRPLHLGNLHSRLFPELHFNPVSSVVNVANVIQRLRTWFQNNNIPFKIEVQHQFHRMSFLEQGIPFGFQLQSALVEPAVTSGGAIGFQSHIEHMKNRFSKTAFSSEEAASTLGVSKTTAIKTLNWAHTLGKVSREGQGRATRYRIEI